jgi:hypothetical protein
MPKKKRSQKQREPLTEKRIRELIREELARAYPRLPTMEGFPNAPQPGVELPIVTLYGCGFPPSGDPLPGVVVYAASFPRGPTPPINVSTKIQWVANNPRTKRK